MPRHVCAGPVMLDLFHRDGKFDGKWLGLHPREFELLWRLAESPRQRLSRKRLLAEVWRLDHDPLTNRVEVHVARLRAKLRTFGLTWLVATHPAGGYLLDAEAGAMMGECESVPQQSLDSNHRIGNDMQTFSITGEPDAIPLE